MLFVFGSFIIVLLYSVRLALPYYPSTLHHSSLCLFIVRPFDDGVSSSFDFGSISFDISSIMFDFDSIPFALLVCSLLRSEPFG